MFLLPKPRSHKAYRNYKTSKGESFINYFPDIKLLPGIFVMDMLYRKKYLLHSQLQNKVALLVVFFVL